MTERVDQTSSEIPVREILTEEEVFRRLKAARDAGTGIDFRSINGGDAAKVG